MYVGAKIDRLSHAWNSPFTDHKTNIGRSGDLSQYKSLLKGTMNQSNTFLALRVLKQRLRHASVSVLTLKS